MKILEIGVPKFIAVARLYEDDDKDLQPPPVDSAHWINNKYPQLDTAKCRVFWVKNKEGIISKAFYCLIPLFKCRVWIDRYEDFFLEDVTHWMPIQQKAKE